VDAKRMNYVSTGSVGKPAGFRATFREAVFSGLAPDGGLYIPESIPRFPQGFVEALPAQNLQTIGGEVGAAFIDDITREDLTALLREAWTFPIPLVKLRENLFLLELFHGPTLAFKDIGARFLARILSHYLQASHRKITIAVATSGDTGSAVAHGFFNVPNIEVYVLYPSGKISRLQEQQMATLGGNIHAIEVDGMFDDCQMLVKQALADREVAEARSLTTANSISLGRLLPQISYYVWGMAQWLGKFSSSGMAVRPTFVVPSGNFGNLTAAVYAKGMGTPIGGLAAATNVNDVGARYLRTGVFAPRGAVQTFSNAMDVGNPSNLSRLKAFFKDDAGFIRKEIGVTVVSDTETLQQIKSTYEECGKVVDPHTAVGLVAARREHEGGPVIVTATAHPAKFPDVIQRALGVDITLPDQLSEALAKPKLSTPMAADFLEFKKRLLSSST
jgi:threonine synthase